MPLAAAASDSRRAGVKPTSCRAPMTRAGAPERSPSSSAQRVSVSRVVSATSSAPYGSPSVASPGRCRRPCSAVKAEDAHHRISGGDPAGCLAGRPTRRRTASRSAKPRLAGQSRTVAGFNSCRAGSANSAPGIPASRTGPPSVQDAADSGGGDGTAADTSQTRVADLVGQMSAAAIGAASTPRPGATRRGGFLPARRSRSRIRDRSSARRAWRQPTSKGAGVASGNSGGGTEARRGGSLSTPPGRSTVRGTELTPGFARHSDAVSGCSGPSAGHTAVEGDGWSGKRGSFSTGHSRSECSFCVLYRAAPGVNTK